MHTHARLLDLVDRIYAAGFGEVAWDEVTTGARELLDCSVVTIHADDLRARRGLVLSNAGIDPDEVARYEAYYVTTNVWLKRAAPLVSTGMILEGEALIPQTEFRRTEYYNDFARDNRMERAMAVCLHHEPDLIAFFSLFKPPEGRGFSSSERRMVELLTPHLQRAATATRISERLQGERALAHAALDALRRGAAVLDRRGRLVFANRRMESILDADDGIFVHRGELRFGHPSVQSEWEGILARPRLTGSGGALRVPRRSAATPYEVVATPLPARVAPGGLALSRVEQGGGWLALVTDPDRRRARPLRRLRALYGLTDAEAQVADLLLAGRTLPEIAEVRGTTVNTTKTQARRIYRKVNVGSRAELVRRMAGLDVGLDEGGIAS